MKFLVVLMFLLALESQISKATRIIYVLPDEPTKTSRLSHTGTNTTLGQYLLDDGTLRNVTNVEYHFLPGEHRVPANMVLTNLSNFSITGDTREPSSPAVLIGCDHSYVLKISASYNVTIRNIRFERCYNPRLQL